MTRLIAVLVAILVAPISASAGGPEGEAAKNWPQWRGPLGTGAAPEANPPVEWSETKNIRWKVEIPGSGHATPIVWGDRVYVQTAIKTDKEVKPDPKQAEAEAEEAPRRRPGGGRGEGARGRRGDRRGGGEGEAGGERPRRGGREAGGERRGRGEREAGRQRPGGRGERQGRGGRQGRRGGRRGRSKPTHIYKFALLAIDRKTGKVVWQRVVKEELPHESGHNNNTQASCSPVTDGEHVYAYFGSRGLFCLDMQGKVVWEKDFGDMRTARGYGEGGAPVLYKDTLIVNWDHEGDSFIVALDKKSGKEKWRVARDERTSWTTPVVVEAGGKAQIITSANQFNRAYDLETGKELWKCAGAGGNAVASPMPGNGLAYVMGGGRRAAMRAVKLGKAEGDVTDGDAISWARDGGRPSIPSAVMVDDSIYMLSGSGVSCFSAKTGKENYEPQRLEGFRTGYASPVAARGRIYIPGGNGATVVLKHGKAFKVLATNTLEDRFDASPAVAGGELYLRGEKHLYCIAETKTKI